jgi:predicted ATPase/DNA-binding winged helix-turn-helix (wHTH) protein
MIFAFGDCELDEERLELRRLSERVAVQPRVLDVLLYVVRRRDRVVLKQELLEAVWANVTVTEASLSRAIFEARRAIGDELQQVLVTARGRGFRFTAPVVEHGPRAKTPARGDADATFVGRAACLAALDTLLEEALGGHGRAVWLSGEAGIGKTRTAEELARRARKRGASVIVARSHETPPAPPYWLFAQIARALVEDRGAAPVAPIDGALAALTRDSARPAEPFPFFDAIARALLAASRERPIVLVLDDVHWVDDSSLHLLLFLVRELADGAMLVAGGLRDGAVPEGARRELVGRLLRESASLVLPLRGLAKDDLPRFVEVTTGSEPSPALVTALLDRTGGNPLYLGQVLRTEWAERALDGAVHELASSIDLQQGMIESILRHLDSVTPEVRELLTVAAVLGPEFDAAKLAIVSGLAQELLFDRLDEAMRARLVIKGKNGAHRFGHTLVRDVLYKKLPSAERAARHLAVGEALFAHSGASSELRATEIAPHFAQALPGGDPARAADLSILAAEQRTAAGDPRAAVKHWAHAGKALDLLRADDARRGRVMLGLARAQAGAGQLGEARETLLDAAIVARTFERADALAEVALGYAALAGADPVQTRALVDEARGALARSPAHGSPELRARFEVLAARVLRGA